MEQVETYKWKGTGTKEDPYQIEIEDHLKYLGNKGISNSFKGKYFQLIADIKLTVDSWMPIGNEDSRFEGTFIGALNEKQYTITGLSLKGRMGDCGFFGAVGSDGHILNLKIEGTMANLVGSVASLGMIAGVNYGTIEKCSCTATKIDISLSEKDLSIGGIVGNNQAYASIDGCVAKSKFMLSQNMHVDTDKEFFFGGVCGVNWNSAKVTGCTVSITGDFSQWERSKFTLGGLVAKNNKEGTINECKLSGQMKCSTYIHGLVQDNKGIVSNCTNSAKLIVKVETNEGVVYGLLENGGLTSNSMEGEVEIEFTDKKAKVIIKDVGNVIIKKMLR